MTDLHILAPLAASTVNYHPCACVVGLTYLGVHPPNLRWYKAQSPLVLVFIFNTHLGIEVHEEVLTGLNSDLFYNSRDFD